jgi:hypothetical protein
MMKNLRHFGSYQPAAIPHPSPACATPVAYNALISPERHKIQHTHHAHRPIASPVGQVLCKKDFGVVAYLVLTADAEERIDPSSHYESKDEDASNFLSIDCANQILEILEDDQNNNGSDKLGTSKITITTSENFLADDWKEEEQEELYPKKRKRQEMEENSQWADRILLEMDDDILDGLDRLVVEAEAAAESEETFEVHSPTESLDLAPFSTIKANDSYAKGDDAMKYYLKLFQSRIFLFESATTDALKEEFWEDLFGILRGRLATFYRQCPTDGTHRRIDETEIKRLIEESMGDVRTFDPTTAAHRVVADSVDDAEIMNLIGKRKPIDWAEI